MDKLFQYVRELTDASRNGKLVFFVGAGVSTLSDYPQWSKLVDKYHLELYGKVKKERYSADEYLRIPQIFHDVKGEEAYNQILEETFSVDRPTNPIHDKILAMNPAHIITTNYDDLIEKTCWKRGKYFSLISAEDDVACATSPKYLLKVHGDFRRGYTGDHIVLKESDYMNFEQDRPLISNLMKTIMATHTIVFIGYGLGDYNINSLLNWVKALQKEGYNKPFFIRTDPTPIEENIAIYYERKGLRILDAAGIAETAQSDYAVRYNTVMDLLIDSRDNNLLATNDDAINYLYEKLQPLFKLKAIRKNDLNLVFEKDYDFSVYGTVTPFKNKGFGYMEKFFEFKKNVGGVFSDHLKSRFNEISKFFEANDVYHLSGDREAKIEMKPFGISNPAYHWDTDEIEKVLLIQNEDLEENYRKAFILASIGKWEEAYNLYSKLLLQSIEESNWWIHYLSQINRFWIYQSIVQMDKQLESIGFLAYGIRFEPFSKNFLNRIEREIKNFDIDEVYKSMPFEFQKKYKILEFLSDNEFLYKDIVKLFELTNKVRAAISKESHSFGLTSIQETQLRLNDNLRFLYDNYLWVHSFQEFTQYMRNSLILQFEKNEFERNRPKDELSLMWSSGNSSFYIDYFDFVNIAKSFKLDDVKHIERSCSMELVEFQDHKLIEDYLLRITDKIIKQFSKDEMNIVHYSLFIQEAKVAFYFAKHIKISDKGLLKIINMLLFYFPERELDVGLRYRWIERLTLGSGLSKEAISVIESFLVLQVGKYADENFSEQSSNGFRSKDFISLLLHFDENFISDHLSNYALRLSKEKKNQVNFLFSLYLVLTPAAKSHILQSKDLNGIDGVMDSVKVGIVEDVSEHQDLILDYLEQQKLKISSQEIKLKSFPSNSYITQFAIWYFMDELTSSKMREYIGIEPEYDFFIDPQNFDYDEFIPSWLKTYSKPLLEKISANEHMKDHLIEILKDRIKFSNDKRYFEIFVEYFM
ncbi:SIR2 family protein [Sporosarcina sp. P33]|uniref:SIR2 family protein n=1 Tax=Sporosarcina sp. P33 TaxID=1930764 RepID=UPI0009C1FF84|nr:SIR2 family protein [Sporosarcina sp. P33]ARD47987.1 hypothetical protein SporoP33_06930 [Sporosarcina sp. P33]